MNIKASNKITVARQPIFDKKLDTYAYELLYRGYRHQQLDINSCSSFGDQATGEVISHTFMEFGLERVIGKHIAFLNMTRNFLISDDLLPFSPDRVVLEILENIVVDDEIITAVENLVAQGYKIALDDFIFNESLWPLIKLAHIIKIDILALSEDQLREHVDLLKQEDVKLLAEKVETQEQYELCKQLGFEYFQGYFFSRPALIKDAPLPGNTLHILRIITDLQDPEISFEDIEQLISQDVSLSFKLLKLLNSASLGLSHKIDSIKEGLVILGLKTIKSWTTLLVLSNAELSTPELMTLAMTRAKMCELIATKFNCDENTGFMAGLFSNLDAIMLHPMSELLEALPLATPIKEALIEHTGDIGHLLRTVRLYEQGLWDDITDAPLSNDQLAEASISATEWTTLTQSSV